MPLQWRKIAGRGGALVFALLVVGLAILGREWRETATAESARPAGELPTPSGAKRIVGFGGPIPVRITLDPGSGRIAAIDFPPNAEDPEYWKQVIASGIFKKYPGLTPGEAGKLPVDAVTGATFSSLAAEETIRAILAADDSPRATPAAENSRRWLTAAALLVLLADLFWFFRPARGKGRLAQLALNVAILGFLTHCYLSFAQIAGWVRSAPHWSWSLAGVVFLAALLLGLFTGRNFYCGGVCPYGCLQELASRGGRGCGIRSIALNFRLPVYLRRVLLGLGVLSVLYGSRFLPFEPFPMFHWNAAWRIFAFAGIFLTAAVWFPRLWCRWFCPCGALLDFFCRTGKSQKGGE